MTSPKPVSLRSQASARLSSLAPAIRAQFFDAWTSVDCEVRNRAPREARVFEVHHVLETARDKFFRAIIEGKDAPDCEAAAMTALAASPSNPLPKKGRSNGKGSAP